MSSILEYKGYHASIEYDAEDNIFVGEVIGITDSLNFHGTSVDEVSLHNTLCDIGQELNTNLTEINSNIPPEYIDRFRQLQNKNGFNLQTYINSYISGDAVNVEGIDSEDFNTCQARLLEMQDYLKKVALEIEEKLK